MSAESKRAWRAKAANREAENEAHRTRRTEAERLAESIRDTIRRIDAKEQR